MSNKLIVSEMDQLHLKLIRENVKSLLKESSLMFDRLGALVLDIAPQIHAGAREFYSKATVKTLDIDQSSGADYIADLCSSNESIILTGSFDVVICTEVLEHTYNPFGAVDEIWRIMKVGGVALVSTPLNFRIHGPLPDCWRFTELGLKYLFRNFRDVKIESLETTGRDLFPIHYTLIAYK